MEWKIMMRFYRKYLLNKVKKGKMKKLKRHD